jgi:hypothetical protein
MMVECDVCHGRNVGRGLAYGCSKCGGQGRVWMPDPKPPRTILGAVIWYGLLGLLLGLLIVWFLRGHHGL